MTAVKIQGTFKKDEREYNGLESIGDELINSPLVRHVVVAVIETVTYEVNVRDGGTKTPKVRLVSVEPLQGDAAVHATKLRDEAYHERTGQIAPPPTLFDGDQAEPPPGPEGDPTAGPWPGDQGYPGEVAAGLVEPEAPPVRQGKRR